MIKNGNDVQTMYVLELVDNTANSSNYTPHEWANRNCQFQTCLLPKPNSRSNPGQDLLLWWVQSNRKQKPNHTSHAWIIGWRSSILLVMLRTMLASSRNVFVPGRGQHSMTWSQKIGEACTTREDICKFLSVAPPYWIHRNRRHRVANQSQYKALVCCTWSNDLGSEPNCHLLPTTLV